MTGLARASLHDALAAVAVSGSARVVQSDKRPDGKRQSPLLLATKFIPGYGDALAAGNAITLPAKKAAPPKAASQFRVAHDLSGGPKHS